MSRLRLKPPPMQRQSHAGVSAPGPDLAWLDKSTRNRYTWDRFPGGVSMWGPSRTGCVVHKPVDHLTLSAEDGEALIARVHLSNWPRADAETVAWVIRMYFYVVCALHEAKLSAKRLRSLLFGKRPEPSPEEAAAASPADGGGTSTSAALAADADGAGVTAKQAPPRELQTPEQATLKGGHRPGTGRLDAAAYAGATRVECHALLSDMHYALEKLRCSACGAIFTAGLPAGAGEEKYSAQARAVLAVSRYDLGIPGDRLQGFQ